MFKFFYTSMLILLAPVSYALEEISLPVTETPGLKWTGDEESFYSEKWKIQAIRNISTASIEIYRPTKERENGAAIVIAPGGAMHVLNIESEGREVAHWLTQHGFVAIVLKYRLAPNNVDPTIAMAKQKKKDPVQFSQQVNLVLPLAITDSLNAINYLRSNAKKLAIKKDKIGIIGFSAGGAVAMGASYFYQAHNRPDFVVPIYPWTAIMPVKKPPHDAPPLLVIAASDDHLDLAPGAVSLYSTWLNSGISASLHMYSKGGHGFGMKKNNFAADNWIEHFYAWAKDQAIISNN